jgi:hypothetical protein
LKRRSVRSRAFEGKSVFETGEDSLPFATPCSSQTMARG